MFNISKLEDYERDCSKCLKPTMRSEMDFTKDCRGIAFRLVCPECMLEIVLSGKGYDGEYYDESDEQIDDEE